MEEEGRRRKKRRRRKGNGGGRECGEGGNELLRMSVEVVQSAFNLLRGRTVIARGERKRNYWCMILKYFLCPQYGEIRTIYVMYFGFIIGRHLYSFWVK